MISLFFPSLWSEMPSYVFQLNATVVTPLFSPAMPRGGPTENLYQKNLNQEKRRNKFKQKWKPDYNSAVQMNVHVLTWNLGMNALDRHQSTSFQEKPENPAVIRLKLEVHSRPNSAEMEESKLVIYKVFKPANMFIDT